jgi:hypothetical protein
MLMPRFALAAILLAPYLPAQPRPMPRPGGQQQARKEYKPEELCTVEGYVRNSVTGEALSKANILLNGSGRPQAQNSAAVSDASGKFVMRGVEPGQFRLTARRNGYVSSDQSGRRAVTPSSTLTLTTGQTIKNVEIKLIPHAVVTGRITDPDGEPIAYSQVQLLRYRYNQQGQRELVPFNGGQSNDLGEYRLFGVPPGKYFVAATTQNRFMAFGVDTASDSDEGPVATYYPGAADPAQAQAIEVSMGGSLQGVDVRLLKARTFRVTGQVTGIPAGRNQGMVMLEPKDPGGNMFLMMRGGMGSQWRQDGKFTIRGVAPGSYTIIADSFDGEGRMRGTADLEVGDRNVENAQVAMQPSLEIQGSVRLEGQGTLDTSNMFVTLQPRQRGSRFTGGGGGRAGVDGKVVLRQIFPGHADVFIGGLPDNHYVKSVRAGEVEGVTEGIHILPGMQVDVIVSPNGGKISGGVVNEKGDAVSSATVILLAPKAPPMSRFKTAALDQQGQFTLSGIAPGDYYLAAVEDTETGAYWEPEFLTKNEKLIEKISIRESATESKTLKLIAGSGQ